MEQRSIGSREWTFSSGQCRLMGRIALPRMGFADPTQRIFDDAEACNAFDRITSHAAKPTWHIPTLSLAKDSSKKMI
ncbi:hypothetical protein [Azospirillum sp. HJ39]|uniref:hypothetical protein n=1 Tax=Azospirillum sp. HJ39 TaxID=3159496 RepID=UPI0035560A5D